MLTVAETETFARQSEAYWDEEEKARFISFLAAHPDAGDVIPGSGGLRKVRWSAKGRGKRGGVRVIYYNRPQEGKIWLLLIYGKNVRDNIPPHVLRKVKEQLEHE